MTMAPPAGRAAPARALATAAEASLAVGDGSAGATDGNRRSARMTNPWHRTGYASAWCFAPSWFRGSNTCVRFTATRGEWRSGSAACASIGGGAFRSLLFCSASQPNIAIYQPFVASSLHLHRRMKNKLIRKKHATPSSTPPQDRSDLQISMPPLLLRFHVISTGTIVHTGIALDYARTGIQNEIGIDWELVPVSEPDVEEHVAQLHLG